MKITQLQNKIDRVLADNGIEKDHLIVVSNTRAWADAHNISRGSAFLLALAAKCTEDSTWDIVIQEDIEKKDIPGATSAMWIHMIMDDVDVKEADAIKKELEGSWEKFVIHLILHEIAHTKGFKEEREADRWAYRELGKYCS